MLHVAVPVAVLMEVADEAILIMAPSIASRITVQPRPRPMILATFLPGPNR
jgi:hypothetical protein